MIKVNELQDFRPQVRYQNGDAITFSTIEDAIKDCAMRIGIPVAFRTDEVKTGTLFRSSMEECLVLYHPQHEKDYFKFCIRISRQGTYAFIQVNVFGNSVQMAKANRSEDAKSNLKSIVSMNAPDDALFKAVTSAIGSIGKNRVKLEEEQRYYACMEDIFNEIIQ